MSISRKLFKTAKLIATIRTPKCNEYNEHIC